MIFFEFYAVVIPKTILEEKYPKGIEGFIVDLVNGGCSEDENLVSARFVTLNQLWEYLSFLQEKGLHCDLEEPYSRDFAVVTYLGPWWVTPWLENASNRCWLTGTN